MTIKEAPTHCQRCRFPIIPRLGAEFISCLSCGWEDYGPLLSGLENPERVPCPGSGRQARAIETWGENRGRCKACDKRVVMTPAGRSPWHSVMSDALCEGSGKLAVRVVYKTNGTQVQTRGCAGCAFVLEGTQLRTMPSHRIAESPKVVTHLNSIRT